MAGVMDISGDARLLAVITDHGFSVVRTDPPAITTVSPASAPLAASLNVAVTGQSTSFVPGETRADFGAGIVVNAVTVVDATHAHVNITVPSDTPIGARDVALTTGPEVAAGVKLFTVTTGPSITRITPNQGQPGQWDLSVEISATMAHFAAGLTTASFGPGITVTGTRVIDANRLVANLMIAPDAAVGRRTVSVTSGSEALTLANGFTVRRLPAPSQPFVYAVGRYTLTSGGIRRKPCQ